MRHLGSSGSRQAFSQSMAFLASGSSTLSKKPALAHEPGLIVRGRGCRVWDSDGRQYIDFRNGLGPVTLGYCFEPVDEAIRSQLENGIVFGHPHPLEGELARLLVTHIPCAEKARFLKTGGEAIAACIRIARAAIGRDKIVHCGYNGWLNCLCPEGLGPLAMCGQDVLPGAPAAMSKLHAQLEWGDITPWRSLFVREGENIAAVVVASDYAELEEGRRFLREIRSLTQEYGCLMIMDEIVTGFRIALGGAHEYFGVMPDMAVFSKGMANGMPISVFVGRADLMDEAENIPISSTFGGETLSLSAAKATVEFYTQNDVVDYLRQAGQRLWSELNKIFEVHGISAQVRGHPACPTIRLDDAREREAFFAAAYKHGVSLYAVSYVNYSHDQEDIDEALERLAAAVLDVKSGDY